MYPPPIQNAIDAFKKLPGIGPRQAARCIFYLLKNEPGDAFDMFLETLEGIRGRVYRCPQCFAVSERKNGDVQNACRICEDPRRMKTKLCVVTTEIDLWAIEDTGLYDGIYFVLGENITLSRPQGHVEERADGLHRDIKTGKRDLQELVIATNHDLEGDTTFRYIRECFKDLPQIKITRLGRGIPRGGEIAYADEETLKSAFEGRG